MSNDDALFIQQTRLGDWVGQQGSIKADLPPDPDIVPTSKRHNTIEEAILANIEYAKETQHGFRFPNLKGYGYGATRRENEGNALFTVEDMYDAECFVARHSAGRV